MEGKLTLEPLDPVQGFFATASAQYGYFHAPRYQWVCDYFGHCGWLDSWNPVQVQGYFNNLSYQYNWLTRQRQIAMMNAMRQYYMMHYRVSRPFVLRAVRSIYCYASHSRTPVMFGQNTWGQHVVLQGSCTQLTSIVWDIVGRGWRTPVEAEYCSAPQSSGIEKKLVISNKTELFEGYRSTRGLTVISKRRFRDISSNRQGKLLVFDSVRGKQMTLVAA